MGSTVFEGCMDYFHGCRMVMAGPDGAATHEGKSAADRDFATVASATAHMAGQSMVCAAKVRRENAYGVHCPALQVHQFQLGW